MRALLSQNPGLPGVPAEPLQIPITWGAPEGAWTGLQRSLLQSLAWAPEELMVRTSAVKPVGEAQPLCAGLALEAKTQARPGGICTNLGLGVDVDPVCLSLVVLWGIGPAPAFRPVAEIRMVTNLCLLAHYASDEDQEGLGSGPRASLDQACLLFMDKDTTPALSPAPEWRLLWQGDTAQDSGVGCVSLLHQLVLPTLVWFLGRKPYSFPTFPPSLSLPEAPHKRGPSSWRGRASQASHTDQLGAHRSSSSIHSSAQACGSGTRGLWGR